MSFYDITRELSKDTIIYPGDPRVSFTPENTNGCRVTKLELSTHSGTHIDAPYHYLNEGISVDKIPPDALIGETTVIDLTSLQGSIGRHDLYGLISGSKRILIKTQFSGTKKFEKNYSHLTPSAAEYLAESGVVCVGVDTPSAESFDGDGTVHKILLKNGIVIIELLDLSLVKTGRYNMYALPLRLKGLDGSPARVILSDI
ncbi:cyclase family protein [Methanoplanus sp. FWC-SCC4]|uniref:Cyclase family protein n=1 Tax=Methanochimaera problematica TaxID=2609417 RepID=A0AA97I461_9EURY|nr:cyclase family protein [Methanoplanus sp. FWC-SCC4]WOF16601.1 cyclase family protein [Methanoplanus sp. FWC-SCC4]